MHSIYLLTFTKPEQCFSENSTKHLLLLQLADTYDNNKPVDILVVDSEGIPGKTHYLLHRAVVRHDKETAKVRIVFDGSAKVDQCTSLNEALYSGPSLLCMIFGVL